MKKTILVVDDEEDTRKTVKTILEKNGYQVKTAVSGEDCIKKVEEKKPDLILLDVMMPGTPVSSIVPKLKKTKVVYLTAVSVSEAEKEEMFSTGNIVDYIRKPYDIDELLSKVKKAIAK